MTGRPPRWVRKWPLRFERSTVHVDRPQFDQALFEAAREAGVVFHWDRLDSLRLVDDRVVDGLTKSGMRFSCRWFLDATGRARLMARTAGIGRKRYGVPRLALWFQVTAPMGAEATTLFFDDQAGQLSWIWEIPIRKDCRSIGVVMPTARFRALRDSGLTPAEIVKGVLSDFPHFQDVLDGDIGRIDSRAFHSYVADRTVGANWLMIGEAAAFVDPLTSLGVTAALRTASEAASVICAPLGNGSRYQPGLQDYDLRVRKLADLYNTAINTLLYEPTLREGVGLRWAARSYVVLGYVTNSLYARILRPSRAGTRRVLALLAVFRAWTSMWRTAGTLARQRTQAPPTRSMSVH
jgi:flavin-dependent dehydrogenase